MRSIHPATPSFRAPAAAFLALLLALLLPAAPGFAQDGFGAAVAVTPAGEVVALKPGKAKGPAGAGVWAREADGAWTRSAWLGVLDGGFPGETVTHQVAVGGDRILLGGGDPDGRVAGHLWERGPDGWRAVGRVPMDPDAPIPGGLGDRSLDMTTLMALMGPSPRAVALSEDGRFLAVAGGALPAGRTQILRRRADGSWAVHYAYLTDVTDEGPGPADERFGHALALGEGRMVVGAPDAPPGGRGHLLRTERSDDPDAPLGWSLPSDSAEAGGLLGNAVALAADEVLLGAPGADRVVRFAPDGSGGWVRVGVLEPAGGRAPALASGEGGPPQGFGASLAVDGGTLLVGAPLAAGRTGRVERWRRDGDGWAFVETLAPEAPAGGQAFGAAVAVRGDVAVVGSPGAAGGEGRVAVYDLGSDAVGTPRAATWLAAGTELERVVGGEVRCEDGEAAGFACQGVDLVSFLPLSALGAEPGERVSDIWGWTDPETGREYALAGRTAGLAFVDVTDPARPAFVGLMPANPSGARDIKVYADHAFMTGDGAGDHGLLVFDLTRLRGVGSGGEGMAGSADGPATFEPDAVYDRVASVHNLVIDTESGFAYTVGTNTGGTSCGGGLHMIDVRTPTEPAFAGCYTDTEGLIWSGRTHDAQCTVYRGPDEDFQGRQICFAANETALRVVDVTDKENPVPVSAVSHPGTAYIHQGWLTEDHRYLYVNDELDEIVGTTDRTRTLIWDVAELDDPILVGEHLGPDQATDHNLYIAGDRAYLANYQAGFRVLDVSDPEHPVEIGWFDTTPYGDNPPGFGGGAWTAWPFFDSGTVIVSSINEGLFLLRPRPAPIP